MELKLIGGCLHVYEAETLIIKTKGNPTKNNELFNSLEEAQAWYATTIPEPILEQDIENVEEVLNETAN